MSLPPNTVLGERFEIIGVLGEGGWATVYLATDHLREERVALKVLHSHLVGPSAKRHLQRELRAASLIHHPNALVPRELHDLDGILALSMPFHPGQSLDERVATGAATLDERSLIQLGLDLSEVLTEAHRCGVIHRDITPKNILIGSSGDAVLTDFGLARVQSARSATHTQLAGTWGYAAPECFNGVRSDPRSDLYSLGAVLYFSATGRSPFASSNPMGILKKQMNSEFEPLKTQRPDLSDWLCSLIDLLLHADINLRPQGALELLKRLRHKTAPQDASPQPQPVFVLPRGLFALKIQERAHDRVRRQRLRRHRFELERGNPVSRASDWIREALGVDVLKRAIPERQLVHAIETLAGLPTNQLNPNEALFQRRFLLVDGVNEDTARALQRDARTIGFIAEVIQTPQREDLLTQLISALPVQKHRIGLFIALSVFSVFMPFVLIVLSLLYWQRAAHLPVAFRPDLQPERDRPAERDKAPTDREPERAPKTPVVHSLLTRAERALDQLQAALKSPSSSIHEVILADLSRSETTLRNRVQAIAAQQKALLIQRSLTKPVDDERTLQHIRQRLKRLRTLNADPQADHSVEIKQLQAALDTYETELERCEELEDALARCSAVLLDIAATANEASRLLYQGEDTVSMSLGLTELKREIRAAEAVLSKKKPQPRGATEAWERPR